MNIETGKFTVRPRGILDRLEGAQIRDDRERVVVAEQYTPVGHLRNSARPSLSTLAHARSTSPSSSRSPCPVRRDVGRACGLKIRSRRRARAEESVDHRLPGRSRPPSSGNPCTRRRGREIFAPSDRLGRARRFDVGCGPQLRRRHVEPGRCRGCPARSARRVPQGAKEDLHRELGRKCARADEQIDCPENTAPKGAYPPFPF